MCPVIGNPPNHLISDHPPTPRRIDIPELHAQAPLPSDRYNQVAVPQAPSGTPGRANYGLFGASSRQQEGLVPYSGMQRMVPGTPSRAGDEDGPAVLSQESAVQLSQEAPQQPAPPAQQHSFSQVGGWGG